MQITLAHWRKMLWRLRRGYYHFDTAEDREVAIRVCQRHLSVHP